LETDLLGKKLNKPISRRTTNLNTLVFKGAPGAPPLNMKLNFLEWKVFRESRTGKLSNRIAELDKKLPAVCFPRLWPSALNSCCK